MSSSPTFAGSCSKATGSTGFKALSRMSSSPTRHPILLLLRAGLFQSAVAHELFSDRSGKTSISSRATSFKALSRMSSSPTSRKSRRLSAAAAFQSAVAHELFSDERAWKAEQAQQDGFKALSRMSSSPTAFIEAEYGPLDECFKALSRMSSSPTRFRTCAVSRHRLGFQSAVAHELFSDCARSRRRC